MSHFLVRSVVALWLVAAAAATADAQGLVARFEVADVVFSPDGDGVEDATNVNFTLSAGATSVSVVVFLADSITPVDTLMAPQAAAQGRADMGWDGTYADGSGAPDGAYVVTLAASGSTLPDTVATRQVVIDTGTPLVVVQGVTPNPYVPGVIGKPSAVDISFTVTGTSPPIVGIPRDEVQHEFLKPAGSVVVPESLSIAPPFGGEDGAYLMEWNAANQVDLSDGEYEVTLTVVDQAGHSSASSHSFVVDAQPPEIKVTEPGRALVARQAPDSLRGWALDTSGVESVDVQYSAGGPYVAVGHSEVVDDTVFFSAQVSDSVVAEGHHTITVRAVDGADREATTTLDVTIDSTPPGAPTLDTIGGVSHTDTYRLAGHFSEPVNTVAGVRIRRAGVQIDSLSAFGITEFDVVVPLQPGRNELTATLVDAALNEGPPSNTVVVTFDDASGFHIDVPFGPNDEFQVNVSRPAMMATVHVYDMTGDPVVVLDDFSLTKHYAIAWDGRNGNGDAVRKGPLVAVVNVRFTDGETTVFREIFLFDPNSK